MASHPSASTASTDHTLCSSPFSDTALKVLRARYFLRDNAGRPVEDASGMLARVARAVASPGRLFGDDSDFWEATFFERMQRREFLPNSPTLMNAGLSNGQLAACSCCRWKTI